MPDVPDIALAEELRRRGIRPSRKLGQNFMVDRQMLDFLVRTANVSKSDTVLEIGTGAGFLTQRLCETAGRVVSVEIDRRLYELSRERLSGFDNLTLLLTDALAGEHSYADRVVSVLRSSSGPKSDAAIASQTCGDRPSFRAANIRRRRAGVAAAHGRSTAGALKLVANLPYSIASAIVQTTLESQLPFSGIWATVQREVAERLCAKPGGREYGFVSVFVAVLADIRIVRKLSASIFWPRPNVESSFIEVVPRADKRAAAGEIERLRRVLSRLFSFRRKELGAALKLSGFDAEQILKLEKRMAESGISKHERVFKLAPETFVEIAGIIGEEI